MRGVHLGVPAPGGRKVTTLRLSFCGVLIEWCTYFAPLCYTFSVSRVKRIKGFFSSFKV